MIETLNDENYEPFVQATEIAVVLFYAHWEHYHPILRPRLELAIEDFSERVNVGEIDVDEWMEIAGRVKIINVPTVLYYRQGVLVETVVGVESYRKIANRVNILLAGAA